VAQIRAWVSLARGVCQSYLDAPFFARPRTRGQIKVQGIALADARQRHLERRRIVHWHGVAARAARNLFCSRRTRVPPHPSGPTAAAVGSSAAAEDDAAERSSRSRPPTAARSARPRSATATASSCSLVAVG